MLQKKNSKIFKLTTKSRLENDPPTPQMCVLCSRNCTQKLFYDMCHAGLTPMCIIQRSFRSFQVSSHNVEFYRYGNIFNEESEYSPECMLVCPPEIGLQCMPLPIMSHQRNRYSVVVNGGHKHLRQHKVAFEGFQRPSGDVQQ